MKLKYDELNLKTKKTLTNVFFKNHNITYDNIDATILYSINNILSRPLTSDRRRALYEMILSKTSLEPDLELRFEKFLNTPLQTPEFFRLKFGDEEGTRRYESVCINRGRGNTLEGQIEKYGIEEGTRRYKEMNEKKALTLENFIRKHGEEIGTEKFNRAASKRKVTLKIMQDKHGLEEGKIRYNAWKESCVSTKENFIKRHGEKLGKEKWETFKNKSKQNKENFILRYGEEEGLLKYTTFCAKTANTKENFIRVYGDELGLEKWKSYKNGNAGYKASKESITFFKPITEFLLLHGMEINDLWFGNEDSFEFKIEYNDKLFSYDYTILPLKIIFEYNGNHVHPSKEFLGEKWDTWKCAWTGESADTKHSFDLLKNEIAEKEGFTVLVIWDFEDKKIALEKCLNLIKLKLNEMKN